MVVHTALAACSHSKKLCHNCDHRAQAQYTAYVGTVTLLPATLPVAVAASKPNEASRLTDNVPQH